MRSICVPLYENVTVASRTEMPRARSTVRKSVAAVPLSTLPSRRRTPPSTRMRSESVVFPASMCAKMPMLSVFMPIL